MNGKNKRCLNTILYRIYVIAYLYVVRNYGMGSQNSQIRYYLLLAMIILGIISLFVYNWKKFNFTNFEWIREKKILEIFFVAILFLIISVYKARAVHMKLNNRTIIQIFLFLLPTIYAFIAINIFSKKEIVRILRFTSIALIVVYFTEKNHSLVDFLNLSNWLNINFLKSSSFTESHLCARSFTILFLFFYYVNRSDHNKSNFSFMIINFIFTVLCFKRLDIIVATCTMIFGRFLDFDKNIKNNKVLITAVMVCVLTILYISLLNGKLLYINLFELKSGRNRILKLCENTGYLSYGYGTSMLVINRYLELDLVQIYMELNLFALIAFVYIYIYIKK